MNHYKDPYETISSKYSMDSKTLFFFVAQLKFSCLSTLKRNSCHKSIYSPSTLFPDNSIGDFGPHKSFFIGRRSP